MLIQILLEKNITASELCKIMQVYPQTLVNAKVSNEKKDNYKTDEDIQKIFNEIEKEISTDGRVIIRPSGTEPLIRVMIEGKDLEYITKRANELKEIIEKKLN